MHARCKRSYNPAVRLAINVRHAGFLKCSSQAQLEFFRTATGAKMGFIIPCSATLALFASSILLQPSNVLAQISTNSSSGPVVDLGYAQYQGNTTLRSNYSTDVYYGIRFAQAPVGQLRWQPPQNIEAHNDYNPSEFIDAQTPSVAAAGQSDRSRACHWTGRLLAAGRLRS
jgi:hypothetical protein